MHEYDYDEGPGVPHVEIGAELHVSVPTLDLDAKVGGGRTVADLIVQAALAKLVKGDYWNTVKQRVERLTEEEIRDHAKTLIGEALDGGIRKTNTYGEPVGEPTTLRSIISGEVSKQLSKAADPYHSKDSVVHKIVREQVEIMLKKELAEAIAEEKAKVVGTVREKAADLIAKAIAEGVGGVR